MQSINKRLDELNDKLMTKNAVEERISEAKIEIQNKEKEISIYNKQLLKEKKDVKKLNSLSFANFFSTLIGNKVERLTREEAEYMNAKIKNDRLLWELNEYIADLESDQSKLEHIISLEQEYEDLLIRKKELIMKLSPEFRIEYNLRNDEKNELKQQQVEVKEAINAGEKCMSSLKELLKVLSSARSWGTADIWTKNSGFISLIKHNKIDQANQMIVQTKAYVRKYKKELHDVKIYLDNIDLEFSGLTVTFDIVFDNIFTDLNVQGKIVNAINEVTSIINNISSSLKDLSEHSSENEKRFSSLEKDLIDSILKYS